MAGYLTWCTLVVCSDDPLEEVETDGSPCTTPDIIRERKPSTYIRKRRTIYTAGKSIRW